MEIFNNILIYFVIVPLLTLGGLAVCRNQGIKAIRTVAVVGASVLMVLAAMLVKMFLSKCQPVYGEFSTVFLRISSVEK